MIVGHYTLNNGIFEYNITASYTFGDVVFIREPNNLVKMFFCIKNAPPGTPLENGEYFVPVWYHDVINTYEEAVNDVDNLDRLVNKRALISILQNKFGTGVLISDKSSFENILDLNNVVHVGKYIVYVDNIFDVLNFPNFLYTMANLNEVRTIYGLDVFTSSNDIYQVMYANINNRVIIAVRNGTIGSNKVATWNDWQVMRNSIQMEIINNMINVNQNLIEGYIQSFNKQVFGLKVNYTWRRNSNEIIIDISDIPHSIFKTIEMVLVIVTIGVGQNSISYSHFIPIPSKSGSYKTFFYMDNIDVTLTNSEIRIDFTNIMSLVNQFNVEKVILMN